MNPSKADLEEEIEELTRGAILNSFLDPWTGKLRRIALGVKLARNRWGECVYSGEELIQIRDWLRTHLWRERGVAIEGVQRVLQEQI